MLATVIKLTGITVLAFVGGNLLLTRHKRANALAVNTSALEPISFTTQAEVHASNHKVSLPLETVQFEEQDNPK